MTRGLEILYYATKNVYFRAVTKGNAFSLIPKINILN